MGDGNTQMLIMGLYVVCHTSPRKSCANVTNACINSLWRMGIRKKDIQINEPEEKIMIVNVNECCFFKFGVVEW